MTVVWIEFSHYAHDDHAYRYFRQEWRSTLSDCSTLLMWWVAKEVVYQGFICCKYLVAWNILCACLCNLAISLITLVNFISTTIKAPLVEWLARLTMNLLTWVRSWVKTVNAQLTWLFILPNGLVDEWVPKETCGRLTVETWMSQWSCVPG